MRAVEVRRLGDPSGMEVVEMPVPRPGPHQVQVRVEAIGVGGVDVVLRRGTLGPVPSAGFVLGGEVAGVVTSVGPGVEPSWIGRRVWAATGTSGGYAEQVVAAVEDVTPLGEGVTSVAAVTLGSAATVAHFALEHAHVAAGERVLVRGAAGSIGIASVQLAARRGAAVVAVTTSSAQRGQRLAALGATHVLGRDGSDLTGPGQDDATAAFDVVVDVVGGADVPVFLDRLAPNGRMVMVGAVAGLPPADFAAPLLRTFQRSRSFATFSLSSVDVARRNDVRAALLQAAGDGELSPVVHEVLPLERAAEAHHAMDDGSVFGRIVLTPST